MERRYQVFVSSTYRDLSAERAEIIQALLELDCIPAGMEMFPASDESQWALIERVIDDCDYYVVIVGGRYGTTDSSGLSYTEREYDYAVRRGMPVLGFVHEDPSQLPLSKSEPEPEPESRKMLEAFRTKVMGKPCKFWKDASDLGGKVSRSLIQTMKRQPREGWIRAGMAADPRDLAELSRLRQHVMELEAKLRDVEGKAPAGSDVFRQGSDPCVMRVTLTHERGRTNALTVKRYTWDDIFQMAGPYLMTPHASHNWRSHLTEMLAERLAQDGQPSSGLKIGDADFDRIKIQLMALGLIELIDPPDSSFGEWWVLTAFGLKRLVELMAEQRTSE